ncbi:hypothetical protein F2Q68_00032265 [Brassica cretica]|uniref:Cytochrome P450 n=1 Tax=Brassica cretica TaxID=69181 RepID=A0A8S9G9M7_BRACR|nr:hypothetical protein F2Q68_00032265 [Brassica cretica]
MAAMVFIDFQNCFILTLLCLISLLCYSLFFRKPKDSPGYDLPPSPPSLPIIGHLHLLLSTTTHKSLQKLSTKYGPLLLIRIFNAPIILVSSASVAYEIFKSHDVNVSTRALAAIDESLVFGSYGIVNAPYGDYWKFMKKLIATKLLKPQSVERSLDPDEFKPERFLSPKEDEKELAFKYLPFGSGRRGCPGGNLSQIFVGTAVRVMV